MKFYKSDLVFGVALAIVAVAAWELPIINFVAVCGAMLLAGVCQIFD